jgi:hypothetical protein
MRGVPGPLATDLDRSWATRRVAALAQGVAYSHFEHLVYLPVPEVWEAAGRPDLGVVEGWRRGVLPESKFRHFRQDRPVASFHPNHHARWTSHELLHRLVGVAWKPGASRLWLATAARLAETLPVALWYFLDEASLRRCPDHPRGTSVFELHCRACEAHALEGPGDLDEGLIAEGRAFVRREIDAAWRSLREGRPLPSRWATLDLCTDGLAYVAAHGGRLRSPEMAMLAERFWVEGDGWTTEIEALVARIESLLEVLCSAGDLDSWGGGHAAAVGPAGAPGGERGKGAVAGRRCRATRGKRPTPPPEAPIQWGPRGGHPLRNASPERRLAGDVASRLYQVAVDCDEETATAIHALVDTLAGDFDLARAVAGYRALHEEVESPTPEDVFAVGYDLGIGGGLGRSVAQIEAGLRTCVPATLDALARDGDVGALVARFVAEDGLVRRPLGHRFADWLAPQTGLPARACTLARVEATLAHLPPLDPAASSLAGDGWVGENGAGGVTGGGQPPVPGNEGSRITRAAAPRVRFADHTAWLRAPREILVAAGCLPRSRRAVLAAATTEASVLLVGTPGGTEVLETRGGLARACEALRDGPLDAAGAHADALAELDAAGALRVV